MRGYLGPGLSPLYELPYVSEMEPAAERPLTARTTIGGMTYAHEEAPRGRTWSVGLVRAPADVWGPLEELRATSRLLQWVSPWAQQTNMLTPAEARGETPPRYVTGAAAPALPVGEVPVDTAYSSAPVTRFVTVAEPRWLWDRVLLPADLPAYVSAWVAGSASTSAYFVVETLSIASGGVLVADQASYVSPMVPAAQTRSWSRVGVAVPPAPVHRYLRLTASGGSFSSFQVTATTVPRPFAPGAAGRTVRIAQLSGAVGRVHSNGLATRDLQMVLQEVGSDA